MSLKRTLFLEFPIYVFDSAKHAHPEDGPRPTKPKKGEGIMNKVGARAGRGLVKADHT
jgi:hypothetical protein